MKHQLEFARFKSEINLTQYAAHLGYEIDRKKSTRSSIAMRNGTDKIIISRRGQLWVYFSVSNDNDNGTIIDFAEKRTNKSLKEIGFDLQSWISGGVVLPEPKNYVAEVEEQVYDPARVANVFKRCRPVTNHAYLEGRGLTGGLLSSLRFAGRIFADRYQNVAFPHYHGKGICGLELKDADKALFVRGSEKTLWRSNMRAGDDTLILSEAVIDALSHAALFPNETALYAATGGGMSPEQAEIIKQAAQGIKSLKYIALITDNDLGGDRLTDKILKAIEDSGFSGKVTRHSPELRGDDWNDVLTMQKKRNP
ncbi:MAG: hypothetical protein CO093_05530 [Alphaproteobacteria bacterium CG_4_9_14_3_um_filter_47_13]|nr:MAG: hypothetical protein CO093_05530 [Alphaproteobacteria bacterium CG_4_9_14_3_um_filter_47_13]